MAVVLADSWLCNNLKLSKQVYLLLCRREWAWALKRDFPHLQFSLNGTVQNCQEAAAIIGHRQDGVEGGGSVHGVMIGRQAFYKTWDCLADADRTVFGAAANPALSRRQVRRLAVE